MTRTKYGIAVILQSFGLYRKMKRMTDAAAELHLMQEGEEILGSLCWPNIEGIEEISMEYWNIRKIETEMKELREKTTAAETTLHNAQQERAALADQSKDHDDGLYIQREDFFGTMEKINERREEIMEQAMAVKRRFEAVKTKAAVLKEEGKMEDSAYQANLKEINSLKDHFQRLKTKLGEVEKELDGTQGELQKVQSQIDEKNQDHKDEASEIYALIGRANRDISSHRAKLGTLGEEYSKLCRQVGRHLNINNSSRECRAACKGHRSLLEQVKLIRRSIMWNKKLIAKAGG